MNVQPYGSTKFEQKQDISPQAAAAKPVRWPNNLTDAEFDRLITRLDLNGDAFIQRLHDLALQAAPGEGEAA
jgi:hypothetical protein